MATVTIDPRNLTQEDCPRCSMRSVYRIGKQVWVYGGNSFRPKPVSMRCSKAKCSWRRDLTVKRPTLHG